MSAQKSIVYYWHASEKNPHFADNLKCVARESCHNAPNVLKTNLYLTNDQPRRYIHFRGYDLEVMSKYDLPEIVYEKTDSNRQNAYRMNKRLLEFAQIINVGWKAKKFSVVFLTLTMPEVNDGIRNFLKLYKQDLKRKGIDVYGHCWALELGQGNNPHYHVCICATRKRSLKPFYPNRFWIGRTETQFVKKDCVRYMSKYLVKGTQLVQNWRRYGVSNFFSSLRVAERPQA